MKEQEEKQQLNETWETPEMNVILVEQTETSLPLGGTDGPYSS
nr:hypothetical protein [uncultured Draconibacterium sp.]